MRRALLLGMASFASLPTTFAAAQETTLESVDGAGVQGDHESGQLDWIAVTPDGRFVALGSEATNFSALDINASPDIYLRDRLLGTIEPISLNLSGTTSNGGSYFPAINSDGSLVAFESAVSDLVANDTNKTTDVFVRDRNTGTTERVSVDSSGGEASSLSQAASISADGRYVAFHSYATNLVPGDTNRNFDVFVRDRSAGTTERVSVDSSGAEGNNASTDGRISEDARFVVFDSAASNLVHGDSNSATDVFIHDRSTGITERVSVASDGSQGNFGSYLPACSANGRIVVFSSGATTLVAGDGNLASDVFVHDRSTGVTERVSVDSSGVEGNGHSYDAAISSDGRFVTFISEASNLVAGDKNKSVDVFRHDRANGRTERVSVDSTGAEGNDDALAATISGDGNCVAFSSAATNLVANDVNGCSDVFLHEACSTTASWSNYGAGFPGTNGIPSFTSQQNPVLGSTVTLDLENSYANPTAGLMVIGYQRTVLPTNRGGDLLVVPALFMPLSFSYGRNSYTGTIADDDDLCGLAIDLQALEYDPGAAKGVSFTPGLELLLGR